MQGLKEERVHTCLGGIRIQGAGQHAACHRFIRVSMVSKDFGGLHAHAAAAAPSHWLGRTLGPCVSHISLFKVATWPA